MELTNIYILLILMASAFIAGIIDTIAGGGGLITVPTLLMAGTNPVAALGTNKLQSAIGELSATLHFMKKKKIRYKLLIFGISYTILGSIIGTICLQFMPYGKLEKIIPFLLLFVLLYYIFLERKNSKKESLSENFQLQGRNNKKFLMLGSTIGFYNGFFGPGTGSIWTLALTKVFKLNLREATMYTKPLNLSGNLTALSIFIVGGNINILASMLMGIGSFLGGKVGASVVIHNDLRVLKKIFISLMTASTIATFIKFYF